MLESERSYDFHIASPWSIECFWQPVSNLERFSNPRPSFRGKTRRKTSQNQLVKDAVLNHFFDFQGLDLGRQTKIVIRKKSRPIFSLRTSREKYPEGQETSQIRASSWTKDYPPPLIEVLRSLPSYIGEIFDPTPKIHMYFWGCIWTFLDFEAIFIRKFRFLGD